MRITKSRIKKFRDYIFSWWEFNKRDLPWRHTHDPYKILVSEIMLQQTQVPRVIARYRAFIARYPTVSDLAQASTADVLKIWKGMGYNRRALYLKKAAALGRIPKTETELMTLPGVGKYTARAILVFAYKQDVAAVDTNIRKIITHFFFNDIQQKESIIQETADEILPKGKSWEWHQALMDFGALALQSRAKSRDLSKKTIPFKQSNRFMRGKIMDSLRTGAITEPSVFPASVIDGLVKDGLAERKSGKIQLPD